MPNGKTLYICSFCGQERDESIDRCSLENDEKICPSCDERRRFFRELKDLPREIFNRFDEIDKKRADIARSLTDEENDIIKHMLGYMLSKIKSDLIVIGIWGESKLYADIALA